MQNRMYNILLTKIPVQLLFKKGPIIPSSGLIRQLHAIKDTGLFYLVVFLSSTPNFHLLVEDGGSSSYHQSAFFSRRKESLLSFFQITTQKLLYDYRFTFHGLYLSQIATPSRRQAEKSIAQLVSMCPGQTSSITEGGKN